MTLRYDTWLPSTSVSLFRMLSFLSVSEQLHHSILHLISVNSPALVYVKYLQYILVGCLVLGGYG